jgi:LytS/YehU family sensor histidine kinase
MSDSFINTNALAGASFAKDIQGSRLLRRRWLYHLLFWLAYFGLLLVLYASLRDAVTPGNCLMYLVLLVFQALFAYVNIYLLIPHLLFARKYLYYGLALLLDILACAVVVMLVEKLHAQIDPVHFGKMQIGLRTISVAAVQEVYLMGMVTGIKFLKDTFLNQQWMKEKEKQYLETELKFLRSQIHPHFFFNTLNNIYSLTLKKSDDAPGVILKLSDLMSYMLYESNVPMVPLVKEIDYLQNYLDVEKLRFGQRLTINFTWSGFAGDIAIPPMILILFLENSFKHGVKNNISRIHIDISLWLDDEFLYFKVENPLTQDAPTFAPSAWSPQPPPNPATRPAHQAPGTLAKGIGLTNVRRRLDLLYGTRYHLDIQTEKGIFSVLLKMPLC